MQILVDLTEWVDQEKNKDKAQPIIIKFARFNVRYRNFFQKVLKSTGIGIEGLIQAKIEVGH